MTTTHDKAVHGRECKGSIPIVPFRYAVMPKVEGDSTQYYYDACPTKLDKGFDKLDTAAYSIRTLRPGYIYLYDEDLGTTYLWEADGEGNYISLAYTYLEKYPVAPRGSPMQNITVCDESNDVYIAYSQDLWTKKQEAINIKNRNDFMVKLNIQEILNGSRANSTQKNILPSSKDLFSLGAEIWVEEYKTSKDDYKIQFNWSSYTPKNIVPIANLKTLATPYSIMHQPKLPVYIALYDNIATAIDLGNIATLHLHQYSDIKNQKKEKTAQTKQPVAKAVPVEMTLDTRKVLKKESTDFYRQKIIAGMIEQILKTTYPSPDNLPRKIALAKETLKYSRGRGNPRVVGDREATLYELGNKHVNEGAERITKHIKMKELMVFNKSLDAEKTRMESISAKVLKANNDHKTVLKTMEVEARQLHPRELASTLFTYDRDSIFSATALENAIGSSIKGMGIPVPEKADMDQRFQLLKEWAENENSPLFMGVKAFNPYKDKIDSLADTYDGIGSIATELHKMFPYALGTNIIVNEITPYTFTKLNGKTRWNKSHSVMRNVNEALKGTKLQKLFKAFQGRYAITSKGIQSSITTKQYMQVINTAVGDHATRSFGIDGTRNGTITDKITTTRTELNSISKIAKGLKNVGLPAGVAWLHTINLYRASQSFSKDDSLGNSLNLGSALFGFAGAMNEIAILTTQTKVSQKIIGKQAQETALRVLGSTAAKKFLGYGGAALEFSANFYNAYKFGSQGDNDAAVWAGTAAVTLGAGGALITTGLIAAAASATVPVAGWFVAGAILIGVGVILTVAGIGAIYKQIMATDRPLEVWVSRTVFGIHRTEFFGDELTDTPFDNLSEELVGHYNVTFSPLKLDSSNVEGILSDEADSWWDENGVNLDQGKFTFLLPGYVEGISSFKTQIVGYDDRNVKNNEDRANATITEPNKFVYKEKPVLKNEGLYVYVWADFDKSATDSASLKIVYYPQGTGREPITKYLYVDD